MTIWSKYIQIPQWFRGKLHIQKTQQKLLQKIRKEMKGRFSTTIVLQLFFLKIPIPPKKQTSNPKPPTTRWFSIAPEALCLLRSIAFVPTPSRSSADPAVAASAAVLATVPVGADAFVFKGYLELWRVGRWKRILIYIYTYNMYIVRIIRIYIYMTIYVYI